MILDNRIKRDFKENFIRNIAMIMIIALSMALVVSLCSSSDCITETIHREWEKCNVEDGSFETYVPLSKRNFNDLSKLDVNIEKMFYTDVEINSEAVLRIFQNRKSIDLPYVEYGSLPSKEGEIFLEKKFAETHGLSVGGYINIGAELFYISGIGCLPDYSYVLKNSSDVAANDEFSVAVTEAKTWERLSESNKVIYNYAYILGRNCSVRDFKKELMNLKADYSSVKDTYIKGLSAEQSSSKENFAQAVQGLKNGAAALADGIDKMAEAVPGADSEIKKLRDGAWELYAGIGLMNDGFSNDDDANKQTILSSFGEAKYNIRINDAVDDSQIGKQAAMVVGVFLIILLVYMLAIFVCGTIERERSIIGTLYALGYSRKEILSHYMKIPMTTAALGALFGALGGFLLTDTMAESSAGLYSFPEITHVFPPYLLAYAIGLPLAASYFINRYVISKKLNLPPLKMMREAPQGSGRFNVKLNNMSFGTKYKIRQFLRELPGNITLFFGISVSVLLIMFSLSCYSSIKGYIDGITDDINYNYMYILRNPVTDLPKNVPVGYTRGFYVNYPMTGGEMGVTLLGIDRDNPYFGFAGGLSEDCDKIYMSDSARIKFGYKPGDNIILRDNSEDKLYAFEIAGEIKYGNGLYFFMNTDAMRKVFGLNYFDKKDLKNGQRPPKSDSFYYNTVFSDKKLSFKHNMMMAELSKAEMKNGADKFMTLMWDMIIMMIAVSIIIFFGVMYLLMKLEIDRASFSISLLKALGYDEKTVNSFYLSGSFYVMLMSIFIGIPICRVIVKAAYPFCISNVNAGFEATLTPIQYVIIVLIILLTYFAVRYMLVRYLSKIKMTEILKNRE